MSSSHDAFGIWQDKEIRFDVGASLLAPRRGELIIDELSQVEDTKGNNGERGILQVSNLRITWHSQRSAKTNLSIGYSAIVSINIRTAESRLRGAAQALYVLTKFGGSSFEFIFTNLVHNSPRLFSTVQAVFRSYDTSKMYRELKLRGGIIRDKNLLLLPKEQIYSKIEGVWNLSSDQGNLGTMLVTNVRIVWFANLAENFNVSIPYIQIRFLKVRDSKFGMALVIETSQRSGGYTLGFRVDPVEKLTDVHKELDSMWKTYAANPEFGVAWSVEEKPKALQDLTVPRIEEDVHITDGGAGSGDSFAAYYADLSKGEDRPPVFNEELGLAMESLADGVSIQALWAVS